MDKVKQIAKYTTNVLAISSALIAGINGVEGITIPHALQIVQIIAVVQGVIGTYLLGQKAISNNNAEVSEDIHYEEVEFDEELYKKNIAENTFENSEYEAGDEDANN